ncbi:hypothetical protein G9464_06025 [Halostella sp. JP-L12]|uniref:hypothetical protein n=1 Tax=Halostella TaxID=1843185 RepID=UPI000EF7AFEE|nr:MULTISPECIES: hypothetical protein [Halostella]NHN47156.1 hypothetical protein [Halostella sp. JP-L12]
MPEDARRGVSRRDWLRAGSSVVGGTVFAAAGATSLGVDEGRSRRGDAEADRTDFVWLSGPLRNVRNLRDNVLAFAARHDLAVVLVVTNLDNPALVDDFLDDADAAAERGVDVWLNVGIMKAVTSKEFVNDAEEREQHLNRLDRIVELYHDRFGDGRIVLWQEAPVSGRWAEGGKWTAESVDNLLEHGPAVFAAQRRVIKDVSDGIDVGIFVHFPYLVDSKSPETYERLTTALRERGATPDFAMVDFYRGWYEKDVGPTAANDAVRSLIGNAREGVDGRDVFYMGQAHTINPNHTPSKTAMRLDLRTAMDADARGIGWYSRNNYKKTEVGFDPFVPNVADPDKFAERGEVATYTIARDRYLFAWRGTLGTRPGYGPGDRFDLWLRTDDVGFHDHRLWLQTAEGDWEYVGDFGGYLDGDYPYDGGASASIFHALDRERFLDGDLELRIASEGETTLRNIAVRPFDPGAYVTEREAASLAAASPLDRFGLADAAPDVELSPGEERTVTVPVAVGSALSDVALGGLEHREARAALPSATDADYAVLDRFDLWAVGPEAGSIEGAALGDRDAGAAAEAVARGDGATVWYGLPRSLLDGGRTLARADFRGGSAQSIYAMPHAGRDAFVPPHRARELVADDPEAAATFSLASDRR